MRIIKVVVMFVFCLVMASEAMASEVAEVVSGPALSFVETELDLGDITSDSEIIVAEIYLYNPGDEVLKIENVHGPCSCYVGCNCNRRDKSKNSWISS